MLCKSKKVFKKSENSGLRTTHVHCGTRKEFSFYLNYRTGIQVKHRYFYLQERMFPKMTPSIWIVKEICHLEVYYKTQSEDLIGRKWATSFNTEQTLLLHGE